MVTYSVSEVAGPTAMALLSQPWSLGNQLFRHDMMRKWTDISFLSDSAHGSKCAVKVISFSRIWHEQFGTMWGGKWVKIGLHIMWAREGNPHYGIHLGCSKEFSFGLKARNAPCSCISIMVVDTGGNIVSLLIGWKLVWARGTSPSWGLQLRPSSTEQFSSE